MRTDNGRIFQHGKLESTQIVWCTIRTVHRTTATGSGSGRIVAGLTITFAKSREPTFRLLVLEQQVAEK